MKIAVTFENGMIFQHFGKTQFMKIYETDENLDIQSAEVVSMGEHSHHSIASYIKELGVDMLICGGIGQGAVDAIEREGIELYAGNSGSCDMAVIKYLNGQMKQNKTANCTHHHDHHHE